MDDAAAGYDAIVLAGGAARRLGGAAKPQIRVGGRTLLDRVLDAVAGAGRVVVVGPRQPVSRPVAWAREDPAGGGPVAALGAGLASVSAPTVLTLAADLPAVGPAVPALLAAVPAAGAALLVDPDGRRNHLAAAWRTDTLWSALGGLPRPAGASMRSLLAAVELAGNEVAEVADVAGWGRDCDTWAEVDAAEVEAAAHD